MLIGDISFRSVQKGSFQVEQKIFIGTRFVQFFEEIRCLTIISILVNSSRRPVICSCSDPRLLQSQDAERQYNVNMNKDPLLLKNEPAGTLTSAEVRESQG